MKNLSQLCDRCAANGAESVPADFRAPEDLEALAQACTARAQQARDAGDGAMASRLVETVQYLQYLTLPYD
jgi:hypothetical protein